MLRGRKGSHSHAQAIARPWICLAHSMHSPRGCSELGGAEGLTQRLRERPQAFLNMATPKLWARWGGVGPPNPRCMPRGRPPLRPCSRPPSPSHHICAARGPSNRPPSNQRFFSATTPYLGALLSPSCSSTVLHMADGYAPNAVVWRLRIGKVLALTTLGDLDSGEVTAIRYRSDGPLFFLKSEVGVAWARS